MSKKTIKKDILSKSDLRVYNIVDFFSRFTGNLSNKLAAANKDLNFLKYQMLFGQKETDIYISTFPKSGTTLTQMIMYQLTTDGNMDFDHIYEKSPWIANDSFLGIPPRELPEPRIIKTHNSYTKFDEDHKGKFIYVLRNGMDVAVSLYHQNKNYNNPDLDFNTFFERFIDPKKENNWFNHTKYWLENKNKLPILYLKYEEIIADMESVVRKICDYFKIELTQEKLDRTLERSSFNYMKKHEDKFGVQPVQKTMVYDQFIRKGESGEGEKIMNEEQIQLFKNRCQSEKIDFLFK